MTHKRPLDVLLKIGSIIAWGETGNKKFVAQKKVRKVLAAEQSQVRKKKTTTSNPSAAHKSMLYILPKNFIEPCRPSHRNPLSEGSNRKGGQG